jgi:drug/metabolite transporter superfamily protein YnfA
VKTWAATLLFLLIAAFLEVGGDAGIRWGLRQNRWGFAAGACALVAYGFVVNLTSLNFARLMGVYIAVFFVVSQVLAVCLFHERLDRWNWIGGALIVTGGIVLSLGQK